VIITPPIQLLNPVQIHCDLLFTHPCYLYFNYNTRPSVSHLSYIIHRYTSTNINKPQPHIQISFKLATPKHQEQHGSYSKINMLQITIHIIQH